MNIWALGDLHLSLDLEDAKAQEMSAYGCHWLNHVDKIEANWRKKVAPEDYVLLPGDLCCANRIEEALPSLEWIGSLPGGKIFIKGNHDNWWVGKERMEALLPANMYFIRNNAIAIGSVYIAGAKGWTYAVNEDREHREKMILREYRRLKVSLDNWPEKEAGDFRIVMTHFPPFDATGRDTRVMDLIDAYDVDLCVFGHLHGGDAQEFEDFQHGGKKVMLVSADNLDFSPIKIYNDNNSDKVRYINRVNL